MTVYNIVYCMYVRVVVFLNSVAIMYFAAILKNRVQDTVKV